MTRRVPIAILVALTLVVSALSISTHVVAQSSETSPVTVHEWGTFTSIAAADGSAVQWQPLSGKQDLPCFVESIVPGYEVKVGLSGTVRMETPVLYFYSPVEARMSVKVEFRQGQITEWYPHAAVAPNSMVDLRQSGLLGMITWPDVRVRPGASELFQNGGEASHYYLARSTDAAPVTVLSEREKFLFYRGIAGFQPSIKAVVAPNGGDVAMTSTTGDPLGDVILFENRSGAVSYRLGHFAGSEGHFLRSTSANSMVALSADLERLLVANGLFEKEAKAMVATWKDSWFEQGTRLFYIAPKKFVDETLPLTIAPAPVATARVFVGRMELTMPDELAAVEQALDASDTPALMQYGRFLQPMMMRILARRPEASAAFSRAMAPIYAATISTRKPCQD